MSTQSQRSATALDLVQQKLKRVQVLSGTDLALRKSASSYSEGDRVLYPGKAGYVLVCTAVVGFGDTAQDLPAWPDEVDSGQTTISDNQVTWTIYDTKGAFSVQDEVLIIK